MINGVVLIGPPGSGKSTIGKMIATALNMQYVSSGDIARRMAREDETTRSALEQGKMAPESPMRKEMYRVLYRLNANNQEFVLDGFPRFENQMKWFKKRFPNIVIVEISTPYKVCIGRLMLRDRNDDELSIVTKRMNYYEKYTEPMLNNNKVITVDNKCANGEAAIQAIRGIYRRMYANNS